MTPFIKLKTENNIDLSDYVESFVYEDCTEQEDMIEVTLKGLDFIELIDEGEIAKGVLVNFDFGFIGGISSNTHVGIITEIEPNYGSESLIIRALDKGIILKRSDSNKIWHNVKATDIVKEVAKKYRMSVVIEETKTVYEEMPQGGQTDFEFLKYLSLLETDGNYIFYVKGETLYFLSRGTDKKSVLTYSYPDNDIISFKPSESDLISDAEGTQLQTTSHNVNTGETIIDKVTSVTERIDTKLGTHITQAFDGAYDIVKNILTVDSDLIKVTNVSNAIKKDANLKILTADLIIFGNPTLVADTVLTMNGKLLKRDIGNWYITKVKHLINSGGYTTILELQKNATAQDRTKTKGGTATKVSTKDVINSSKGKSQKEDDKIVVTTFDNNGTMIGGKTSKGKFIALKDL